MKVVLWSVMFVMLSCATQEKQKRGDFTYQVEGQDHIGYIQSGVSDESKAPGVIVVHEWWGHNDYARSRVDELAEQGFVAMSIDMYGEGKQADHPKDASSFAAKAMSDFDLAKKRFLKAVEILKSRDDVNQNKIVAIGYCFGGGVVLNMARAGVDLDLVASFHGSLKSEKSFKGSEFKGKVMVFNGAADPMVKKEHINNFIEEVKEANIPYRFVNYPEAQHAFTNPKADKLGEKFNLPLSYNKKADEDSWQQFLTELKKL
ncbi:MAG: dienelactone hydrolase [Halobacteriovoraceae bacterium]|nr:dienelactone hydrolase [Halobacteriovoraceae bacterium]|tara:strand:+ start:1896 stop:2675 length:780 start_codon:yes stop_codon:yes gene_type:complete